ncbi:hypothetical protein I7I50_10782 [Histoplasma capsulatum G186AR]|uniref:Uncharacterized protein n=1 Tax=Ajellomyces capsulatus TaxID=5037 RepID=A0A8H7Z487_AJECA|nr:hypothetical protein I7I52_02021 [Histoplasma capsulatum]QSS69478.1 hypothetical protein I7I50_10782 [Histoplasma capsulatum G186AR]
MMTMRECEVPVGHACRLAMRFVTIFPIHSYLCELDTWTNGGKSPRNSRQLLDKPFWGPSHLVSTFFWISWPGSFTSAVNVQSILI